MTLLSLQNLWSDIVWSTTNSSLSFTVELELSCQSEISNFYLHFVIQEKIAQFEISVNYSVTMKVLYCCANLIYIALSLKLVEPLSSSQKLVKRLIVAQFEQDINIFSILKKVLEANNIVMMQTSMNLNFTHKLLLGS